MDSLTDMRNKQSYLIQLLSEIKTMNITLNKTETDLRNVIQSKYKELKILEKEYTNIVDVYTQIVKNK